MPPKGNICRILKFSSDRASYLFIQNPVFPDTIFVLKIRAEAEAYSLWPSPPDQIAVVEPPGDDSYGIS